MIKREIPDIPDREVKTVKSTLMQEDVKKAFEYRDGDLYWKIDISIRIKAGNKAGGIHYEKKTPYMRVKYQRKDYRTARLIFLMFNGYLPENITYKDGDTLNTRIENLIEANNSEIQYRRKLASNNTSNIKGVSFNKQKNKWVIHITKNCKNIFLGYYNTKEEAEKAYLEAKEKYYGEFLKKCKS